MSLLSQRHMLGLADYSAEDIQTILDTALQMRDILDRPVKKVPTLRGVTVVNLFLENSTRTRTSFELAEKRLSADTLNFSASGSALSKGETMLDTALNIEAMKVDVVVMRHKSPGSPHFLARHLESIIINAGDGRHEHPTQGLLDMLTLRDKFGTLKGLRVALVGDILHSRVAMSNIIGLKKMGAEVIICGPATLIPRGLANMGVEITHSLDDVIQKADALNILRIQLERQSSGLFPSLREYHKYFGVNRVRLEKAATPLTILHPGPINRGVEITSDVADSEHSVILQQVTNGVAVRMAVLYLLAGGRAETSDSKAA
ncbi:aspartate carbamoyltransferase catalytic subunit [bacterium]|jgi:aspartate carbamoyltransferase catalytic subunit|nr:aspartate carbamoyltransferase catalytic subunit [bacterium]